MSDDISFSRKESVPNEPTDVPNDTWLGDLNKTLILDAAMCLLYLLSWLALIDIRFAVDIIPAGFPVRDNSPVEVDLILANANNEDDTTISSS